MNVPGFRRLMFDRRQACPDGFLCVALISGEKFLKKNPQLHGIP